MTLRDCPMRAAKAVKPGLVLGLGLGLLLAACSGLGPGPRQVAVLDGQVKVRAPQHYCVAQEAARSSGDNAVVLIGRCTDRGEVAAALVTVTIGKAASAGILVAGGERLATFLASPAGRRVLSRSGRAQDVEVLASGAVSDRLLLHLNDRMVGEYWRAIIGVQGRLVTISALGSENAPLPPEEGRVLVEQSVDAVLAANPATKG